MRLWPTSLTQVTQITYLHQCGNSCFKVTNKEKKDTKYVEPVLLKCISNTCMTWSNFFFRQSSWSNILIHTTWICATHIIRLIFSPFICVDTLVLWTLANTQWNNDMQRQRLLSKKKNENQEVAHEDRKRKKKFGAKNRIG